MATIFRQTSTYSNLTRLELEQLRRSDFQAGGKALTVGDSGLLPEGILGEGDINAEPYASSPTLRLDDVYGVPLPVSPAVYLQTTSSFAGIPSETVQWYGPQLVGDGTAGYASGAVNWEDDSPGINFTLNVAVGDMLLIKATTQIGSGGNNRYAVGRVDVVNPNTLDLDPVNSYFTPTTEIDPDGYLYSYVIARPHAVQLFAVPGSGPKGREQTFMMVLPTSTLHGMMGPAITDIEADRVTDIVPPNYSTQGDRADSVTPIDGYFSFTTLDKCGYRVVLYPDDGSGTAPDLYNPILADHPVIDASVAPSDQRMTIDYKAGIVRFSCAPATGSDIKPNAGCVNATTGRLNLYAVYWAIDQSMTTGAARQLWATRGDRATARTPSRIAYDSTRDVWVMGATLGTDDFFVRSLSSLEDPTGLVQFGAVDSSALTDQERAFTYRRGRNTWTFNKASRVVPTDPLWSAEMELGEKLSRTVGDMSAPPQAQADFNPLDLHGGSRSTASLLTTVLAQAASDGFGTVHLRKGRYDVYNTLVVPPGVTIEGEGAATRVYANFDLRAVGVSYLRHHSVPAFRFGPNTAWGVYDSSAVATIADIPDALNVYPAKLQFTPANPDQRLEGMDVVWNPTRRVWAVVYADATSNAIWFNEFTTAGNSVFPGLGVDIKNTATELYTNDSVSVGFEHTPGHYPRIAHHQWTDEYSVVWVEKVTTGSGDGPNVVLQTYKVNVSTTLGGTPSFTYKTRNYIAGEHVFSDHPSVAISNSAAGNTTGYGIALSFWSYDATLANSHASCAKGTMTAGTITWTYGSPTNDGDSITSSTDVAEDGHGGFMYVWSHRSHRLVFGTHGKIYTADGSDTSILTDTGYPSFTTYGLVQASKVLLLGLPKAAAWTWDSHNFLAHPDFISAYGLDCTVISTSVAGQLQIKSNETGMRVAPASAWKVTNGAGATGAGTSTLTDATKNFTALGVQVGDVVYRTSDYGHPTHRGWVVTVVAPGGDNTKLTVDRTITDGDPITYDIMVGREFKWAVAPPCHLRGMRYNPSGTFGTEVNLVGGFSNGKYRIDTYEPDFVRLSRGGNKWLLVYQSFDTTARLAGKAIRNFDDGIDTSYLDSGTGLDMQDNAAVYREHIATCSLLLNDAGVPCSPVSLNMAAATSYKEGRISRDIEVSHRSLGAHDPVTQRPNYYVPRESTGHYSRYGQHMAREISLLNFVHRWTANRPPSLLPDVTWSGSDWTVVSPSKEAIHSFTGTYDVETMAPDVFLGDPTFYFGDQALDTMVGQEFLRRTVVTAGDRIFFPSVGFTAVITEVISEHMVRLDSNPLGFGVGRYLNTEWVLVRDAVNFEYAGGIKNPGFRVSADGDVIVASDYITFADSFQPELPSTSGFAPDFYVNRLETMRRIEEDTFQRGITKSYGWNLPGNPEEDGIEQQSRYVVDVGFRGVAVGEPKTCSRHVLEENPCCAISWGENLYGYVDRWMSETENEVRFYRQSFGPYNNCIRNLHIEGCPSVPANNTSPEMQVLTRQHVYTRHGEPVESTGNFATDGYRNCFVYPDWRVFRDTTTFAQTYSLKAVYTDAFGCSPITVEGPKTQLSVSATPGSLWFASGLSGSGNYRLAPNPSAPKVIWDGQRFVAAWIEGGFASPSLVCLGAFPGDENATFQTAELLNPGDILAARETAQATRVDYRDPSAGSYHFTVLDVAYSGNVYAVLWADGFDKNTVVGPTGTSPGAALGVTLFDAVGFDGSFETDLHILATCSAAAPDGVSTGNNTFSSAIGFFVTRGVRKGDVLSINSGNGVGKYRVVSNPGVETTLVVDRNIPAGTFQAWTVHRRRPPSGGRTYVLGVMHGWDGATTGEPRDAFVNPRIVWDGKQFAAVWRGKSWCNNPTTGNITSLQKQFVPESGLGQAPQIVKMAAPDQWIIQTDSSNPNPDRATLGIGYVENALSAEWIHLSGSVYGFGQGFTPQPNVRPGDILVITSTFWNGTGYVHTHNGWYRITEYDPQEGRIRLYAHSFGNTGAFPDGDIIVYGAILSTGVGDSAQAYSKTDSTVSNTNLPEIPESLGATPGIIPNNDWGRDGYTASTSPQYVYGLVYNEKRDEFAILYQGNDQTVLTSFKRGQTANRPVADVELDEVYMAALGWNGQHYLVVWSDMSYNVNWHLYSQDFTRIDSGSLTNAPGSSTPNLSIIGNSPDQQPGPLTEAYKTGLLLKARPRNFCIQWNPRLNRWVVSLSMLWSSDESTTADSNVLANRYYIYDAYVSWVGRVLTFGTGTDIAKYAQPGCKLMFLNGGQNVACFTILDSDSVAKTITIDGTKETVTGFTAFDPTGLDVVVLPREDVWVYTLGHMSPAVQFLDADGSSLENVTIANSPLDIEERYNHMARPIWQSGGPSVGTPAQDLLATLDVSALQRRTQYSSRMLTPTMKVEQPRFSNVRSRTLIKYGHGLTPGEPSIDRYAFGDRNRKG